MFEEVNHADIITEYVCLPAEVIEMLRVNLFKKLWQMLDGASQMKDNVKRGSDRFCVSVLVSVHVHLFGAKDERTVVQTENDETTQAEKIGVGLI